MTQNPNSIATRFKTERPESCTAQINIRIPPSLKEKLKNIDRDYKEEVREFLEALVEKSQVA